MSAFGGKVFKGNGGIRSFAPATDDAAGGSMPALDRSEVLAAIMSERVQSPKDLADAMNVTESTIEPVLADLSDKGFLADRDGLLSLSESGERALTYSRMAKF